MNREDHREKLRILTMKVREARDKLNMLAMLNRNGRNPMELADLEADYSLAQADVIRAETNLARAIVDASA